MFSFHSSFASFNAAKELPFDLEDALLLWINKVNSTNEKRIKKVRSPETSLNSSPGRFRFKRDQVLEKSLTLFPKLDDLQMDVSNGRALLSLLLFYCPDALSYESKCIFMFRFGTLQIVGICIKLTQIVMHRGGLTLSLIQRSL